MKIIFISGIAGFLGSHLAALYLSKGWEVHGNDNFICSSPDRINALQKMNKGKLFFYNMDCCDYKRLKTTLDIVQPDVLVHAAATAHEGLSVFSPHEITRNIFEASTSVFSAAIAAGGTKIIYCSSMARYGDRPTPFHELMEPKPVDPYGIAKVAAEDVLKSLGRVHDFSYTILVPHNIIGEGQTYDDPFRNVVAIMINRMLQGKQPVIYGDGQQKRCFSYIKDVLSCFEAAIEKDGLHDMIINVGPDEGEITILELAELIAKQLDFKLDPIFLRGRPLEVKHATCSSDGARAWLDYETKHTVEEAIAAMIVDIRERGAKPFRYWTRPEIVSDLTPKTWLNEDFI